MPDINTFRQSRKYRLHPEDVLRQNCIEIRQEPRYYTTCPRCSAKRKKEHQKLKCLGVTRPDDERVYWGCNHCGWQGPRTRGQGGPTRPREYVKPKENNHFYPTTTRTLYNYTDKLRKVKITRPDGSKKMWWEHLPHRGAIWKEGTNGVETQRLLYRFLTAKKMALVYRVPICVVEGEKDVDCLMFHGFPATCNAHGASEKGKEPKWYRCHSEQLAGLTIAVFNDNDDAGLAHSDAVCRLSVDLCEEVRVVDHAKHFPGTKDIAEWFKHGGQKDDLRDFIEGAPSYGV